MQRTARITTLIVTAVLASLGGSLPVQSALAAQWGFAYGDQYGFCAAQSLLPASYGVVVTNDR